MHDSGGPGQDLAVGRTRRGHEPDDLHVRQVLERLGWCARHHPGREVGMGSVSDRGAAKAKTHLNVALTHLDEAARLARETGLRWPADALERLARDATEVLGKLQAAPQPTPPVDQAAGDDDRAAAS
jgi:hypothetical protein